MTSRRAILLTSTFLGVFGVFACATSGTATTTGAGAHSTANAMTYGGGDGSSCDQAVVIKSKSSIAGITDEYAWLEARFPGYEKRYQALTKCGERPVDKIGITTANGKGVEVVFDISAFFGKF